MKAKLFLTISLLALALGFFSLIVFKKREKNSARSGLSCGVFLKELFKVSRMDKAEGERAAARGRACLSGRNPKTGFLILERALKLSQRRGASLEQLKGFEKSLAEAAFYKLENYEKALEYYMKLLQRPQEPGERFLFQHHIAESFFRLKKYSQAEKEAEKCFFRGLSSAQRKKAYRLKGRILLARRKFDEALLFFKEQIQKFPEEESFFREYRAFIYEAKKDFPSAMEELQKIQPAAEFIELKIQRLFERQKQQPGGGRL